MVSNRPTYGTHVRCFRALVEESSDFLAVASVDGVLQYINTVGRAFLGIDRLASAYDLRMFDLIVPNERQKFVDVLWPALLSDGRCAGDLTLRSFKTGQTMKASVNCARIERCANQEPAGVAILCRKTAGHDRAELELRNKITRLETLVAERNALLAEAERQLNAEVAEHHRRDIHLKRLQRELQRAVSFAAAGQVASSLAHELNQPLTAATNYLNAARRLAANLPEGSQGLLRTYINEAAGQMVRAAKIVHQLAHSADRREDQKQVESLPLIVRKASSLAVPDARALHIKLRYHFGDDATDALIDRTYIKQVFVNLLRNALEALLRHDGRELSVSTRRRDDDTIEVEVSGTGKSLPGDLDSVLHEPFERARRESTILRLLICKAIVEAYGGRLYACTNRQGDLSVRFTVPAAHNGMKPDAR